MATDTLAAPAEPTLAHPTDLTDRQIVHAAARRADCTVRHPTSQRVVHAILLGYSPSDGQRGRRPGTIFVKFPTTGRTARLGYGELRGIRMDRI